MGSLAFPDLKKSVVFTLLKKLPWDPLGLESRPWAWVPFPDITGRVLQNCHYVLVSTNRKHEQHSGTESIFICQEEPTPFPIAAFSLSSGVLRSRLERRIINHS